MKIQKTYTPFIFLALLFGCFGASCIDSSVVMQETSMTNIISIEEHMISLTEKIQPSVVSIIIKNDPVPPQYDSLGGLTDPTPFEDHGGATGFFIDSNGFILTNEHVVANSAINYVAQLHNGNTYPAKVLWRDIHNDLAILKIDFISKPLSIRGKESKIKAGQFVIAIGNTLSQFQNSVSFGIVSGINRSVHTENKDLNRLIQTDAAIHPGNSGGPLLNIYGNVIGINTAIASEQGIGFATPISQEEIHDIMADLKENGKIKHSLSQ